MTNKTIQAVLLSLGMLAALPALADYDLAVCIRKKQPPAPLIPPEVAQATISAYKAAYPLVLGRPAQSGEATGSETPIMTGKPTYDSIGCVASYDGVAFEAPKLSDAIGVIKARLLAPSNGLERVKVIDLAYYEAMGRVSSQEEQMMWDVKIMKDKLTFAAVKSAQLSAISQNNPERKAMLERAYQAAYGRPASAVDLGYWGPRKEQYIEVRKAQLAWLYGQGMQAELPGTVTRALTAKLGRPPTEQEGKLMMAKAMMAKNVLYEDMLSMP